MTVSYGLGLYLVLLVAIEYSCERIHLSQQKHLIVQYCSEVLEPHQNQVVSPMPAAPLSWLRPRVPLP
jgi:hypothetical protein